MWSQLRNTWISRHDHAVVKTRGSLVSEGSIENRESCASRWPSQKSSVMMQKYANFRGFFSFYFCCFVVFPYSICCFWTVIAGMERFAFKGVASNLVTYLTDVLKMSNSTAAKTVNSWCGFTSMLPLLVAPLADYYWDQYSTILVSCSLYVLVIYSCSHNFLVNNIQKENLYRNFHVDWYSDLLSFYFKPNDTVTPCISNGHGHIILFMLSI